MILVQVSIVEKKKFSHLNYHTDDDKCKHD